MGAITVRLPTLESGLYSWTGLSKSAGPLPKASIADAPACLVARLPGLCFNHLFATYFKYTYCVVDKATTVCPTGTIGCCTAGCNLVIGSHHSHLGRMPDGGSSLRVPQILSWESRNMSPLSRFRTRCLQDQNLSLWEMHIFETVQRWGVA